MIEDMELDRLTRMAQREADQAGAVHAVVNLNRAGRRLLACRQWHDSFAKSGAGLVLAVCLPGAMASGPRGRPVFSVTGAGFTFSLTRGAVVAGLTRGMIGQDEHGFCFTGEDGYANGEALERDFPD